jgi:hypothetical protein
MSSGLRRSESWGWVNMNCQVDRLKGFRLKVDLVCLVSLVSLVCLVEPDEPNQPDKRNQPVFSLNP